MHSTHVMRQIQRMMATYSLHIDNGGAVEAQKQWHDIVEYASENGVTLEQYNAWKRQPRDTSRKKAFKTLEEFMKRGDNNESAKGDKI
ncbi:MAG: hypothetical protein GOVbin4162_95 [Prokaryotic dsDNA virus sp.]|nr:MAG: hypothetical protein GOVbin4162_95 [Prokaryotic dsDNA virus sp.]